MPETPSQTDTYNTALDIFDRTHPLRVDAEENLKVTGTFTPTGTQDVNIIGSVPLRLALESVEIGTVDQGTPGTAPWPVTFLATPGTNKFASSDTITNGIETTLLSYIPAVSFGIGQLVGWGTYDAEFLIRVNGTIVGGGRSSPAQRTLSIVYTPPIPTMAGDTITVTVLEYGSGLQQFRVNLLGD